MSLSQRWQRRRFERFQRRIQKHIDAGQWSRALAGVIDAAQWATDRIADPTLWMDLIVTATSLLPHLDDPAEYRAFLDHFAIPFFGDRLVAPRWLQALADLSDDVDPASMVTLGRWLADALPDSPLGPYIAAHFRPADHRDAAATTADLEEALRRARHLNATPWVDHLQLRLASHLIATGDHRRRGRSLLTSLTWSRLAPRDQLHMALALASCPHWTDRLRAMDILLDIHRARSTAQPGYGDLSDRRLHDTAAAVFKFASLDLPPAESHRLRELIDTLFIPQDRPPWRQFLDARRRLHDLSDHGFDGLPQALDELRPLDDDPTWTPLFQRLQLLHAGWHRAYPGDDSLPARQRRSQRFPIADAVAQLLHSTDDTTPPPPALLTRLADALEALDTSGDGAASRPVALFFARLIEDRPPLTSDHLPPLTTIASRYARLGPTPSFGWWQLAAHLFAMDQPTLARPFATRALSAPRPDTADKLYAFVVDSMLQLAISHRDLTIARRWMPLATDPNHGRSPS